MSFYADIDLDFGMHPFNRDISKKYDEAAISRSIRNIVLTNKYERPFKPEFGGEIRELLFENLDIVSVRELEKRIENIITQYEPRVKDVSVVADLIVDESAFECTVYFTAINNREPTKITLYLKRVR